MKASKGAKEDRDDAVNMPMLVLPLYSNLSSEKQAKVVVAARRKNNVTILAGL